jgi:hypothetical protein
MIAESMSFWANPFFRTFTIYVAPQDKLRASELLEEYQNDRSHSERPGMKWFARGLLVLFVSTFILRFMTGSASPSRVHGTSLTGHWVGEYTYAESFHVKSIHVRFDANLIQQGDRLEGTIVEPNTFDPLSLPHRLSLLTATLFDGKIVKNRIRFRKQYNGENGHSQSVEYQGIYNPEGGAISGQWNTGNSEGPFWMRIE